MRPDWFVIADDLTGALEVGAKFADKGQTAAVVTNTAFPTNLTREDLQVLIVDTETRHLEGSVAESIVYDLACASRRHGIHYLYKKTDSALRGNIGRELNGIAAAFPGEPILYAPAYPSLGRTVRSGSLFIDGTPVERTELAVDPLNPIAASHIPSLLQQSGCRIPVILSGGDSVRFRPESCVLLHDGQTENDLRGCAAGFLSSHQFRLAAGSAGLAQHLADCARGSREDQVALPVLQSCLVVNGSLHAASRRQIEYAREHGWDSAEDASWAEIHSSGWVLLNPAAPAGSTSPDMALRTGRCVAEILGSTAVDGVVVFGGDTAHGIHNALRSPTLYPIGEVVPGVPISKLRRQDLRPSRDARGKDLYIVSKAGSFGETDILTTIRTRVGRT
jgi:uncharacterized protein YgbK (DUF1537 family)